MKCFQVLGDDIISGLPIVWNHGRPHVLIGHYRAYISNELLESNLGMRLLRCEAVLEGGQVVFKPEGDEAIHGQAVLVCFVAKGQGSGNYADVTGPTGGAVIRQNSLREHTITGSYPLGVAGLVRLVRGNAVIIRSISEVPIGPALGWRSMFQRQHTRPVYSESPLVVLEQSGRLEFCQILGNGCQALPPA